MFIHLHDHSDLGSPRDSVAKIKKMLEKAKENGMSALAITDHGSITSWVEFEQTAHDKGIGVKPIFGVEMYEADKEVKYYHSVFLAKNYEGCKFIHKMVTESYNNFYVKPRYTLDWLKEHADEARNNVIWLSACVQGRLPRMLQNNKNKEAESYLQTMIDIFGKENVFVEVQNHGIPEEISNLPKLAEIAKRFGVGIVATNDVHFVEKEDFLGRQIMLARDRKEVLDRNGMFVNRENFEADKELYFKSETEMSRIFRDYPEAISNTQVIADMCEDICLAGEYWHYPDCNIEDGSTPDEFLRKITFEEAPKHYEMTPEMIDRINMELETMKKTNASAYMLIDRDFTVEAKKMMEVGPGRGSCCGSAVAKILGITKIDPIKYDLYFERKRIALVKQG